MRVIIACASAIALAIALASSRERSRVRMNYVLILFQSYLLKEWNSTQCVKLTVATSPMATENYPLATYFVLTGAILGDQLP